MRRPGSEVAADNGQSSGEVGFVLGYRHWMGHMRRITGVGDWKWVIPAYDMVLESGNSAAPVAPYWKGV